MSSDTRPADQFALALLIVVLLGLLLAGCGSSRFTPETPHPDSARMQELLNAPVPASKARNATKFHIEVPPVVLWGNSFRVVCVVPESLGPGRVRVAVEGLAQHEGLIEQAQTSLTVPHAECGTWVATCAVGVRSGIQRVDQEVEVRGGMCSGG